MQQHEAMGFAEGWGQCADQLAAICEGRSEAGSKPETHTGGA